jgi:hypothetical protein
MNSPPMVRGGEFPRLTLFRQTRSRFPQKFWASRRNELWWGCVEGSIVRRVAG